MPFKSGIATGPALPTGLLMGHSGPYRNDTAVPIVFWWLGMKGQTRILPVDTTMIAPTCYLQDLYTLEAERGKGVGRALIEAVYARAKADGLQRVYWQTHETNHTAMKLYDKVAEHSGFVVYRKAL